ncbi:hypothetical protein HMPREF9554_02689 [Treponema phagedenis F0421]|nr:hypothetical protein HMPREF9554_02689 [Treponema phagedenis F0421]
MAKVQKFSKLRPMVSLPTVVKLRTATDARGSKQQRCFRAKLFAKLQNLAGFICHGRQKLNRCVGLFL